MLLAVLGSFVFVAVGLWMIITRPEMGRKLGGGLSILTFGTFAAMGIKRMNLPPKYLVVNATGVRSDAFPGISEEVSIRWSEVQSVSSLSLRNQPFVVITTQNQDQLISSLGSGGSMIAKANATLCGSPFVLSAMNFAVPHRELLGCIDSFWKAAGMENE